MHGLGESAQTERRAAGDARAFHDRMGASLSLDDRKRLAEFAASFYTDRLKISATEAQRRALDEVAEPDTLLLEMAHDGQLPHLGVVRLVLKAHDVATADGRALTLYLVGNHYTPAMRPENLRFGMPLKGNSPEDVKHPPRIRVGKASAHTPFRWLPPPPADELDRLQRQVADFVANNVAHEKESGEPVARDAIARIGRRLEDLFLLLRSASSAVESFGDWLIRVQHDLFRRMLGSEADRILVLPMADLTDLFRTHLAGLARQSETISRIKADVSREQAQKGDEPYQRGLESGSFWIHCPSCFRRQRARWSGEPAIEFACEGCGRRQRIEGADLWRWLMPDIVAYEVGLFRLGIDGWIVGSHAAYHPVIERLHARLSGSEMPPKFFLTSVPTFRGTGDPPEGYRRTRLLRAFLEAEPAHLGAALRAPWSEDPAIRSDLFSR